MIELTAPVIPMIHHIPHPIMLPVPGTYGQWVTDTTFNVNYIAIPPNWTMANWTMGSGSNATQDLTIQQYVELNADIMLEHNNEPPFHSYEEFVEWLNGLAECKIVPMIGRHSGIVWELKFPTERMQMIHQLRWVL